MESAETVCQEKIRLTLFSLPALFARRYLTRAHQPHILLLFLLSDKNEYGKRSPLQAHVHCLRVLLRKAIFQSPIVPPKRLKRCLYPGVQHL